MSDLAARMRELSDRVYKLAKKTSDLELLLDDVAYDLTDLASSAAGAPAGDRPADSAAAGKGRNDALLEELARAGVPSLEIIRRSDDSADVRVADGIWFSLTPMLTDLLSILAAASNDQEDDGLVGWHPFADVAAQLSKKSGHVVNKHAVSELLSRLRARLVKASVNPRLVQVSRRRGIRFALRRRDAPNRDDPQ